MVDVKRNRCSRSTFGCSLSFNQSFCHFFQVDFKSLIPAKDQEICFGERLDRDLQRRYRCCGCCRQYNEKAMAELYHGRQEVGFDLAVRLDFGSNEGEYHTHRIAKLTKD